MASQPDRSSPSVSFEKGIELVERQIKAGKVLLQAPLHYAGPFVSVSTSSIKWISDQAIICGSPRLTSMVDFNFCPSISVGASWEIAAIFVVGAAILRSRGGVLIISVDLSPLSNRRHPRSGSHRLYQPWLCLAVLRKISWQVPPGQLAYLAAVLLFIVATKLTTAPNAVFLQYTMPIYIAIFGPVREEGVLVLLARLISSLRYLNFHMNILTTEQAKSLLNAKDTKHCQLLYVFALPREIVFCKQSALIIARRL